jgi:hypothetical protein
MSSMRLCGREWAGITPSARRGRPARRRAMGLGVTYRCIYPVMAMYPKCGAPIRLVGEAWEHVSRANFGHDATPPTGAYAPTRPELLVLARTRLASELAEGGHLPACGCECGKAANASALAAVSRELRAVMAEIEALPRAESESASGSLAARVFAKTASGH